MKALKRIISAMLAAAIIFSLAACGKDGSGAVLRYPIDEEPACLDPQIAKGLSAKTAIANCFEGLVRFDENGKTVPGVAESWSRSGSTYIFKLRKDASWVVMKKAFTPLLGEDCDKTFDARVTAADFVFALRRAVDPVTAAPDAASLYVIKNARDINSGKLSKDKLGVTAVGDYELKIELENNSIDEQSFLSLLTQSICMPCNETFFNATKGRYGLDHSTLICNGPFYLFYWTREASLTLKASPDYKGYSPVMPASVTLFFNSDNADRLTKLSDGVYCAAPIGTLIPDEDSKLTYQRSYDTVWSLCFNCAAAPLNNAELRRALCSAISSDSITVPGDDLKKTFSVIPASCAVSGADMSSVPVTVLGHNSQKAAQRFKNALSSLKVNSVTLELMCIKEHENAMRRLIQDWQQTFGLGINISITAVEKEELDSAVQSGEYQIALAPITANVPTVQSFLLSLTSSGENNIFAYSNKDFDRSVNELQSLSGAELLAACRKAEGTLLVSGAVLPLFSSPGCFAVGEGVSGLFSNPDSSVVSFVSTKYKD